jgi:hypothetical protein
LECATHLPWGDGACAVGRKCLVECGLRSHVLELAGRVLVNNSRVFRVGGGWSFYWPFWGVLHCIWGLQVWRRSGLG